MLSSGVKHSGPEEGPGPVLRDLGVSGDVPSNPATRGPARGGSEEAERGGGSFPGRLLLELSLVLPGLSPPFSPPTCTAFSLFGNTLVPSMDFFYFASPYLL